MVTHMERTQDREKWWSMHDMDEYICPDCGRKKDEHGRRWEVHHLDGVAGNCVALCQTCHQVRHGADAKNCEIEAWKEGFLSLGT